MATLKTLRAAADSLGFETEYRPPLLMVTLLFRIRLLVVEEGDGIKTRIKYGPYSELVWEVLTAVPLLAAGYYFIAAKRLEDRGTVLVVMQLVASLALLGACSVLVGHRKRQLLQRAHQLEIAGTPGGEVELSGG
jgi:hypothetical protein